VLQLEDVFVAVLLHHHARLLSSQSCLCCALLGNKSSSARCLGNLDPGKPRFLGKKFCN